MIERLNLNEKKYVFQFNLSQCVRYCRHVAAKRFGMWVELADIVGSINVDSILIFYGKIQKETSSN